MRIFSKFGISSGGKNHQQTTKSPKTVKKPPPTPNLKMKKNEAFFFFAPLMVLKLTTYNLLPPCDLFALSIVFCMRLHKYISPRTTLFSIFFISILNWVQDFTSPLIFFHLPFFYLNFTQNLLLLH